MSTNETKMTPEDAKQIFEITSEAPHAKGLPPEITARCLLARSPLDAPKQDAAPEEVIAEAWESGRKYMDFAHSAAGITATVEDGARASGPLGRWARSLLALRALLARPATDAATKLAEAAEAVVKIVRDDTVTTSEAPHWTLRVRALAQATMTVENALAAYRADVASLVGGGLRCLKCAADLDNAAVQSGDQFIADAAERDRLRAEVAALKADRERIASDLRSCTASFDAAKAEALKARAERDALKASAAPSGDAALCENSVLQRWVMALPRREQGTLLTGVRGCDLAPKPMTGGDDTPERQLTAFLRFLVMNPADAREVGVKGAFFQPKPPENWKPSQLGHYPQHWYSHVMHCYEVVGYRHPDARIREIAFGIYRRLVHNMHLEVEGMDSMVTRLSEDRIKTGTVVS